MEAVDEIIGEWSSWSIGSGSDNLPIMMGSQNVITLALNHSNKFVLDDISILPTIHNRATSLFIDRGGKRTWYIIDMPYAHQLPTAFDGPDASILDVTVGYLYIYISSKYLSIPLYLLSSNRYKIKTYIDGRYYYIPLHLDDGTGAIKIHINGINYTI